MSKDLVQNGLNSLFQNVIYLKSEGVTIFTVIKKLIVHIIFHHKFVQNGTKKKVKSTCARYR
jgi:hypothetical protein